MTITCQSKSLLHFVLLDMDTPDEMSVYHSPLPPAANEIINSTHPGDVLSTTFLGQYARSTH